MPTTVWRRRHSRGRTATGGVALRPPPPTRPDRLDRSAATAAATWTRAASNRGSCRTCAVSRPRATTWSRSRNTTSTPTRAPTLRTWYRTARSTSTDRRRSDAEWKITSRPQLHRTAYTSLHFDHRPPVPRTRLHPPLKARCLTATSDTTLTRLHHALAPITFNI